MYRPPELKFDEKRMVELNFAGTIAAGAWLTHLSGRIMYPFRVLRATMVFNLEAANLVEHRWYHSGNRSAPTTGAPSDTNIFGRENPTTYFIGDGLVKEINCNVKVDESERFIKLSTFNGLGIAYYYNCSLIIQEI